jgi:predicted nucleotidyltransferase
MNGVDLVVELPLYYSIQNAEIFSSQAVKILEYLELDMQIFGAEEEEISKLEKVVHLQSTDEYKLKLKHNIKQGNDYNKAQSLTLDEYGLSDIMKSNNILGLEYIRSKIDNNFNIEQKIIKREKVGYNESFKVENIASATYIRTLINKFEKSENEEIASLVPKETYEILKFNEKSGLLKDKKELLFQLFKYKFLTSEKNDIIRVYDVDDDIYNRIVKYLMKENMSDDFFKNIESRNYSKRRMYRIFMNVLLEINSSTLNECMKEENSYVRILGFNEKGQKHIKKLQKDGKKIFVNWKDIEKSAVSEVEIEKIKIEKRGFLLKELIFSKKEQLNPIIVK